MVGLGKMTAMCDIPNDIQPATPPGGLFGPDFMPGIWQFPGYEPPSDITNPELPDPDPHFYIPIGQTPRWPKPRNPGQPGMYSATPPTLPPGLAPPETSPLPTQPRPPISGGFGGNSKFPGPELMGANNGSWDTSGAPRTPDGTYYAPGYVPGGSNPELDKINKLVRHMSDDLISGGWLDC